MFNLGLESVAAEILVGALAIHAVYFVIKILWKHRDPSKVGPSSRRTAFSATISFETNSEPPPAPSEEAQRKITVGRVLGIGP